MSYIADWWHVEIGKRLVSLCIIGGIVVFFAVLFAIVYIAEGLKRVWRNTKRGK